METRPLIGVTIGDPAGIGPEIVAKALAIPALHAIARLLVLGLPPWWRRPYPGGGPAFGHARPAPAREITSRCGNRPGSSCLGGQRPPARKDPGQRWPRLLRLLPQRDRDGDGRVDRRHRHCAHQQRGAEGRGGALHGSHRDAGRSHRQPRPHDAFRSGQPPDLLPHSPFAPAGSLPPDHHGERPGGLERADASTASLGIAVPLASRWPA